MRILTTATLAILTAPLCSHAEMHNVSFSAVVTYSAVGADLPVIGENISGRFSFDYASDTYTIFDCGPGCLAYSYQTPYESEVVIGGASIHAPYSSLTVEDNSPYMDPMNGPRDAVSFGFKIPGYTKYALYMDAAPTSFVGADIPAPDFIESFWERGTFVITNNGIENQLTARLVTISVSSIPDVSTGWLFVLGLVALSHNVLRRREA